MKTYINCPHHSLHHSAEENSGFHHQIQFAEVLQESYRKALKCEPSALTTAHVQYSSVGCGQFEHYVRNQQYTEDADLREKSSFGVLD